MNLENLLHCATLTNDADVYLSQQQRKRKSIQADGNCLFRALSHLAYGIEDKHATFRESLIKFILNNRPAFEKYIMTGSFEEHVKALSDGAWGTQVELFATASYYQLPVYVCSPHPQTDKYRWLVFQPVDSSDLLFDEKQTLHQPNNSHVELCHTWGDHFDCVLNLHDAFPLTPPHLDDALDSSHLPLDENQTLHQPNVALEN